MLSKQLNFTSQYKPWLNDLAILEQGLRKNFHLTLLSVYTIARRISTCLLLRKAECMGWHCILSPLWLLQAMNEEVSSEIHETDRRVQRIDKDIAVLQRPWHETHQEGKCGSLVRLLLTQRLTGWVATSQAVNFHISWANRPHLHNQKPTPKTTMGGYVLTASQHMLQSLLENAGCATVMNDILTFCRSIIRWITCLGMPEAEDYTKGEPLHPPKPFQNPSMQSAKQPLPDQSVLKFSKPGKRTLQSDC